MPRLELYRDEIPVAPVMTSYGLTDAYTLGPLKATLRPPDPSSIRALIS